MKKSIIMAALSLISAANLYALDEEFMTVTLKDGTTAVYNVLEVEKVEFSQVHTDEAFTVTPAGGETIGYVTIPSMLRVKAAQSGDPTQFAFGTVEATSAEELCNGEYAVWLTVSAAKIYNGEFDLAESTDSYILKLVKYVDGQAEVIENVTAGTISTSVNSKNQRVTIAIDATFDDGTAITANYTGSPADVESVEAVIPAKQYGNEVYFYDLNYVEHRTAIESVKKSYSSYSGKTTFTFNLEEDLNMSDYELRFVMDADMMALFEDGETHTVELKDTPGWELRLGSIQLYCSPDSDSSKPYKNQANNGTLKIRIGEDGTYDFFIDILNCYTNYSGEHTDPQHIILNYSGTF